MKNQNLYRHVSFFSKNIGDPMCHEIIALYSFLKYNIVLIFIKLFHIINYVIFIRRKKNQKKFSKKTQIKSFKRYKTMFFFFESFIFLFLKKMVFLLL